MNLSKSGKVWANLFDQYVPEHDAHLDPNLRRGATRSEIAKVENIVKEFCLHNVSLNSRDFWR